MQYVCGRERRTYPTRRTSGLGLKWQLRWQPGSGSADPSGESRHGGRSGGHWSHYGCTENMSMQPFTLLTGQAAPLMLANIDTDVIIRIERLSDPSPAHLHLYALEALRHFPDGSENPEIRRAHV